MLVASLCMESIWEEEVADQALMFQNHFQLTPSPLTSSLTLHVSIPPTLDTEQLYTPASLSARLSISSCELSLVLVTLLPSPRRNSLPSFSQRISGAGMPVKEHTSSKWSPSVWVMGAGRFTMVGLAVWEKYIHMVAVYKQLVRTKCCNPALTAKHKPHRSTAVELIGSHSCFTDKVPTIILPST